MFFCTDSQFVCSILAFLSLATHVSIVQAQGRAYGAASGVTGGGNAAPAAPRDIQMLKAWLADSTPRVILIDRLFDFTDSEGNTTGPGCAAWPPCKNGGKVQVAIDFRGWCSQAPQSSTKRITVNYRKAAMTPLVIGSNKSLRGVGNKGVIKGKGLVINRPSKNIIIQNIEITYLNPFAVWGGDALTFNAASNVWVDHCTFSLIGRQMISSGSASANVGITLSNNHFQGKTPWSSDCAGQHYWTVILGGAGDQITIADNCFDSVSGRAPKLGAIASTRVACHVYNNYYSACRGQNIEVGKGGSVLAEGNAFEDTGPGAKGHKPAEAGGLLFAPMSPQEGGSCQSSLGRGCSTNLVSRPPPGGPMKFVVNNGALNAVRVMPSAKSASVKPANTVLSRKLTRCGKGKM